MKIAFLHQPNNNLNRFLYLSAYGSDVLLVDKLPRIKKPYEIAENYLYDGEVLFFRRSMYAIKVDEEGHFIVYYHPRKSTYHLPIEVLLWLQLLKKDLTFVHAAGLKLKEKVLIFPAWPGVGKTSLTIALLKSGDNWSFLGDDMVILSRQGIVYSYPRPFAVYSYHIPLFSDYFRKHPFKVIRLRMNSFVDSVPIISEILAKIGFKEPLWVDFDEVFSKTKIAMDGALSRVYLLSKSASSTFGIEECRKEDVSHHIINVLFYDLLGPFSQDVFALSAFGFFNFFEALKTFKSILSDALSETKTFKMLLPTKVNLKEVVKRIESHVWTSWN